MFLEKKNSLFLNKHSIKLFESYQYPLESSLVAIFQVSSFSHPSETVVWDVTHGNC